MSTLTLICYIRVHFLIRVLYKEHVELFQFTSIAKRIFLFTIVAKLFFLLVNISRGLGLLMGGLVGVEAVEGEYQIHVKKMVEWGTITHLENEDL